MSARRFTRREVVGGALATGAALCLPGSRARAAGSDPRPAWLEGGPLPWRNWSGFQRCQPVSRLGPASETELLAQLAGGTGTIRPAGAGHSFSALVPCDGALLFLDSLAGIASVDASSLQAEVFAGTRLGMLGPELALHGQALPNLPDIDYQTLGGAIATSTHGTGASFGSLSSTVVGLTLATPTGELLECDAQRNAEVFQAARTSLGALGVVTRFRLQNTAAFKLVEKTSWRDLDDVLANLARERAENRYFEFYAFPHSDTALAIATNETAAEPYTVGEDDPGGLQLLARLFAVTRWLPGIGTPLYDAFLRNSGTTERADWSYRVLTHPRTTRFNEMEYTVPVGAGPDCLREILRTIRERDLPICFPIECRTVREDEIWLSMFYERPGFSISVHQFADLDFRPYFAAIEPIFWKYEGRPHWGKLHTLDAARLAALYPRWREFRAVRRALDPTRRLVNAHLATLLGT
jgi:FAD-linked oxidoreductase